MSYNKETTAREVALLALDACERQGAWSDAFLKSALGACGMDARDAGLATKLCFGVLQNMLLLDFWREYYCRVPRKKLEEKVRLCLLLGMYQMAFLTRVPARAAVDESVKLARKYSRNPRSPGLVNGVLRSFDRAAGAWPMPGEEYDPMERLSIRYSHPLWLTELLCREVGQDRLEDCLRANNEEPPTMAQVNPLKGRTEDVARELEEAGVQVEVHPWLPGCLMLRGSGDLEHLPAFAQGRITIQDAAAKLAVKAAGVTPGMTVLDACAAPGGKSFAAAMEMEDRGHIYSCDVQEKKLGRIRQGAQRLGISIVETMARDARKLPEEWFDRFDCVIADVPCSGLGIIRKKPDIRYKAPEPLLGLPAVQGAILERCACCVKPGGTLIYSTCTVLERENQAVVRRLLAARPDYELQPFSLYGIDAPEGTFTFWPHVHGTDGFFVAKLRRRAGKGAGEG